MTGAATTALGVIRRQHKNPRFNVLIHLCYLRRPLPNPLHQTYYQGPDHSITQSSCEHDFQFSRLGLVNVPPSFVVPSIPTDARADLKKIHSANSKPKVCLVLNIAPSSQSNFLTSVRLCDDEKTVLFDI